MDRSDGVATEEFSRSADEAGELEALSRAYTDLSRSLTEALEQARLQASEIVGRAQDYSNTVVRSTDRRLAEALRQATTAERRAGAAQDRLASLEDRIEQAQSRLAQLGDQALEIARLVTTTEITVAAEKPLGFSSHTLHTSALDHAQALNDEMDTSVRRTIDAPDLDPLAALALLRNTVEASR
jgi:chromosome segregation ATPase